MSRRLKQAAVVFVVVFAAAQLVRPERANAATDVRLTIQAHVGTPSGLVAVLDRACRDCHSNGTMWPWYTQIAPASWLMAYGVAQGRKAVNFSEWAAYPETRLSAQDVETICVAARQAEAHATDPEPALKPLFRCGGTRLRRDL